MSPLPRYRSSFNQTQNIAFLIKTPPARAAWRNVMPRIERFDFRYGSYPVMMPAITGLPAADASCKHEGGDHWRKRVYRKGVDRPTVERWLAACGLGPR